MPTVWSKLKDKLMMKEWSFPYNCYEIGHAWEPSCSASAVDLSLDVTEKALGMYSALYLASFIIQRRYNWLGVHAMVTSTLRSSAFLGFNCLSMFTLVCALRRISGGFYFSLFSTIPATLGSLMAIYIEHPGRRKALAFYCANIASECIYRVTLRHSNLKPVPKGEVLLFTASISALLYITSRYGLRRDPIGMALKLILGRTEFQARRKVEKISFEPTPNKYDLNRNLEMPVDLQYPESETEIETSKGQASDGSDDCCEECHQSKGKTVGRQDHQGAQPSSYRLFNQIVHWIRDGKHQACGHSEACPVYTLKGFSTSFLALWFGQAALVTGLRITSIRRNPSLIYRTFTNSKKLKLCLFASLFTGIYRSSRCSLRWLTNSNEPWHSAVAGALSGPTMLYYPSPMIAINIAWKCLEWALQQVCSTPYAPSFDRVIPFLFAASVNIIFVTLVLEPSCLRPSYIKFIDTVSQHKLHQVNRSLLRLFGTDAHIGYEDFFPDLVPEYCSNKFVESVLIWLL